MLEKIKQELNEAVAKHGVEFIHVLIDEDKTICGVYYDHSKTLSFPVTTECKLDLHDSEVLLRFCDELGID